MSATAETGDRSAALRRVAVGAAVLAVAVIAASCSSSTGGTAVPQHSATSKPAPASAAPVSDEDQVRQTVSAFNDAYNSQNWEAYTELMCVAMRNQFTGVVMDYVKKNRANTGANTIKSIAVTISGDSATASITGTNEAIGSGTISLPLKREDGWKVCQIYHP
jgi:rhamnose utilization protein RhaD (predicted bifunctional aldolase and dehydrogenase)